MAARDHTADHHADQNHPAAFAEHRSQDVLLLRADRLPDRDLLEARSHRQRQHAVDADERERRRHDREPDAAGASQTCAGASDSRRICSMVVARSTDAVGSTLCTSRRTSANSPRAPSASVRPDVSRTRRSARTANRSPAPAPDSRRRCACRRRPRRSSTDASRRPGNCSWRPSGSPREVAVGQRLVDDHRRGARCCRRP